jgi:aminopeptidase N
MSLSNLATATFRLGAMACAIAVFVGCAGRSTVTLDTGLPMSDSLQAYDVQRYTLRHEILMDKKAIRGSATIRFKALEPLDVLELDFDGRFRVHRVEGANGRLDYRRSESSLFVTLDETVPTGEEREVSVSYRGKPLEAVRAPWDGGFVWSKTPSGEPWVATAFQGEGCDIWWPCKDHPSDEPEGLDLFITVPEGLTVAANGVLVEVSAAPKNRRMFHWQTNVPTNLYGVALNIAPYIVLKGTYHSTNGTEVPLAFWAIQEHESKARELFDRELPSVIEFFERMVGPYPWGSEKLGIAETPHLGMEHQTVNAYGNEFKRDDYGFDWLLHHELAHEWFGNLVSVSNYADLWIHEGFAAYMQPVYTREVMGEAAFYSRMYRIYLGINGCNPVAPREEMSDDQMYGDEGPGGDIYGKAAWVLHSLRYLMGDEAFWEAARILVYGTPNPVELKPPFITRHRTTDDFLEIVNDAAKADLSWFFEVYLRSAEMPALVARQDGDDVTLEWTTENNLPFDMPIPVRVGGELSRAVFSDNRATLRGVSIETVQIDPFMQVLRKLPSLPTCEEREAEAIQLVN